MSIRDQYPDRVYRVRRFATSGEVYTSYWYSRPNWWPGLREVMHEDGSVVQCSEGVVDWIYPEYPE